jgi:tRNA (cmo5U34)-methyltransferase
VAQFHWDPETYLALMREELPNYERLQREATVATGIGATRVLELGVGTGETTRRVSNTIQAPRLSGSTPA